MGILEFMMLLCFGFSWPFSIMKSIRSRSTAGKSLLFMVLVETGYVFGILNKLVNNLDWVVWVYVALFVIVGIDIALYVRNARYGARPCARSAALPRSRARDVRVVV